MFTSQNYIAIVTIQFSSLTLWFSFLRRLYLFCPYRRFFLFIVDSMFCFAFRIVLFELGLFCFVLFCIALSFYLSGCRFVRSFRIRVCSNSNIYICIVRVGQLALSRISTHLEFTNQVQMYEWPPSILGEEFAKISILYGRLLRRLFEGVPLPWASSSPKLSGGQSHI